MGPAKTCAVLLMLLVVLLGRAAAASAPESSADGPEARVELDDDDVDFEEGEYLVPKTVLECVVLADWACVQVKTVRAIRLWLNLGTDVVHSKPQDPTPTTATKAESKEGVADEDHEDLEEPDTDDDLKEVTALFAGLGKVPEDETSWSGSLQVLAEMLYDGVSAFLGADSEDEQRALVNKSVASLGAVERGLRQARRKKLGFGHGHHGLGALLGVVSFIKTKAMLLINAFSALLQLKALVFSVAAVIIAALQLFIDFKTKSRPLHPIIKVVHLHPRPHVTVNAGADFQEEHGDYHADDSYDHGSYYGGYGAHDRAYQLQRPTPASLTSSLLSNYKNQLLAAGRR